MEYDNTLLYCRSCKQKINSEAEKCPQCGASDPFYFVKVRNTKKAQWPRIILALILSIAAIKFIQPQSKYVAGICFVVLYLILWGLFEFLIMYVLREDKQKYSDEMKKICDEINDEQAFKTWSDKMDAIIG